MAYKVALLSLFPGALLVMFSAGCSPGAVFGNKQGIQGMPYQGQASRGGPVKQLASKVSESSLGRSVSKAFKTSHKKYKPAINDPVSLATKTKPPDADFYVEAGNVCANDNDTENARINYHQALSMKAHHLGALLGLARLFDRQGQLERATEHYLEAAKHHPTEAVVYNDLGLCYARRGKYDDAVKALSRAVELQPDRALYRNNIATVLVVQGRIDEALAHLTDAHGAAIAHYNIGFLLNKRGDDRKALEQFKLALVADPNMTSARQWIESLSAELAPESRQPEQIARGVQPAMAANEEPAAGPALGPSLPAANATPSAEVEAESAVDFERQSPLNRLRESEPADAADAAATGATPPAADSKTSPAEASPAIENSAPAAAAETGEAEAKLQYLPPVVPRKATPSRY